MLGEQADEGFGVLRIVHELKGKMTILYYYRANKGIFGQQSCIFPEFFVIKLLYPALIFISFTLTFL